MNLRLRHGLVFLFFTAVVLSLFAPAARFGFVSYDDGLYVYENSHVLSGINRESLRWLPSAIVCANWHPLTMLSLMLDVELFGKSAGAIHVVNVFLHLFNVILLFIVLRNLTGAFWRSALVAALFAVHPMRVESVVWISERKDVLSGFFFMITLLAYVRYAKSQSEMPSRNGLTFYLLALFFFALGLMSKSMLVTVPCVLLLLDVWPLKRTGGIWKLIAEKIPFFVLSAIFSAVTLLVQQQALLSIKKITLKMRIFNALTSYAVYLKKTFWPVDLAVFYPFSPQIPFMRVIIASALLIGISIFAWRQLSKRPYFFTGWFWFAGMLVPVIGFFQVGLQAMADRYTYLTHIGLFIAIVWGLSEIFSRSKALRLIAAAASLFILGMLTHWTSRQIRYWENGVTLFEQTLRVIRPSSVAYYLLGMAYLESGKSEEARQNLVKAVDLNPRHVDALVNLANIHLEQGWEKEALNYYTKAFEVDPFHSRAHFNAGVMLERQGRWAEAVLHYERALESEPEYDLPRKALERIKKKSRIK